MESNYVKREPVKVGDVYANLTVCQSLPAIGRRSFWLCKCKCGASDVRVRQDALKSGHVKSCGCLRVVAGAENGSASLKHGKAGTPEYVIWTAMWQRCTNPKHKSYELYKDKAPPESWKDFETFYADMGARPDNSQSVERLDNDKAYGPENCVWGSAAAQARNKRSNVNITYEGRRMCATDWAKEVGISVDVILYRFHAGWSTERILTTKVRK